jgi:hypothetical protein
LGFSNKSLSFQVASCAAVQQVAKSFGESSPDLVVLQRHQIVLLPVEDVTMVRLFFFNILILLF